ncbi:glycosyltransferase [Salegentibacter sp. JZCK2]|uniref:glycosyltransferase family 2 protein n=1 Tax=Salegentibacter tibetensis TaxID=2873600 RepID=UPI001CCAF6CB|nr:glycosyltransferase family 2 protein [Salegentibacter tibetensis]MBZ9729746.1 glycosyltransferase [Salegentibacter tibetensis]
MQPFVSIIIPTFNRVQLIGETLDSVLAQNYTNWECIVVDDGSTDYTDELMEFYCNRDSRIQFHYRPKNCRKGANACRNYGFEMSKGEYINWFDDDDIMLEDFLKVKISSFTDKSNMVICSGYYVNAVLLNKDPILLNKKMELFKDYVRWKQRILTPSVLFRRSFLEQDELFSEVLTRGQEVELFSRLFFKISDSDFILINDLLFLYRQHLNSKTFRNKKFRRNFVYSQSLNMAENYKRGIILRDTEVIEHCYKYLMKFFFSALKNNDRKISFDIWIKILKTVQYQKLIYYLEVFTGGLFLIFIRRSSVKVEKRWKNFKAHNFK